MEEMICVMSRLMKCAYASNSSTVNKNIRKVKAAGRYCLFVYVCAICTALHAFNATQYSHEKAVCPSVCLSNAFLSQNE